MSTCYRLDSERIIHQRVNTVPFVLVGSDQAAVKVQSPLQADGLYTEITNERFHQATYNFGALVDVFFNGEKSKGHLEVEEMLKVSCLMNLAHPKFRRLIVLILLTKQNVSDYNHKLFSRWARLLPASVS